MKKVIAVLICATIFSCSEGGLQFGDSTKDEDVKSTEDLEVGGFRFDLPRGHQKYAKAAVTQKTDEVEEIKLNYRSSNDFQIKGINKVEASIVADKCDSENSLASSRAAYYERRGFDDQRVPRELSFISELDYQAFALKNNRRVILEYVFEKNKIGRCLVFKSEFYTNSTSFNIDNIGDYHDVLRVIVKTADWM